MQEGEAEVVANRLHGVLTEIRQPKNEALQPAKVDLTGHWRLQVDFLSGSSEHFLFLDQQENWIEGYTPN